MTQATLFRPLTGFTLLSTPNTAAALKAMHRQLEHRLVLTPSTDIPGLVYVTSPDLINVDAEIRRRYDALPAYLQDAIHLQ